MEEFVNTEGSLVPEVVLEAFVKASTAYGKSKMMHIRVTGNEFELDQLVLRFTELLRLHRYGAQRVDGA